VLFPWQYESVLRNVVQLMCCNTLLWIQFTAFRVKLSAEPK